MKKSLIFYISVSILLISCNKKPVQRFEGNTFGTKYSISYVGEKKENIKFSVDSLLEDLSKIFSIFDTNSIIFKFNKGEDVEPNSDFLIVTNLSLDISEFTDGAFDCTIQPLVDLWGFGKDGVKQSVPDELLDSVRQYVGFEKISVTGDEIWRDDNRIQLNFNAIAKGYAVEKVADLLVSQGIRNCIVEIGGEVAVRGNKNGQAWKIGIQTPCEDREDPEDSFTTITLPDHYAVATSGNYRNYFEENGTRFTHILDPTTGKPERSNLLSVSVIAPDCATADAFATAFMVLGIEKSTEIIKKSENLEAWFIVSDTSNKTWNVINISHKNK